MAAAKITQIEYSTKTSSDQLKYNEAFRGVFFFRICENNFKSNFVQVHVVVLVQVVVLVLQSKGLY